MTEQHQQKRTSDGSRSRTGCITCRIRKKKCDEQRPACLACRSRQLACYGFDVPTPTWYTGKANWKEVRDSDEAKSLRTLAETRYKICRKAGSKNSTSTANGLPAPSWEGYDQPHRSLQLLAGLALSDIRILSPFILLGAGMNIWQLHPETIWWDSKIQSLTPDLGSSSNEETRLLMLFLDVIHPITHTFYKLSNSSDRSWMLNRLVSKQALYCSALSISACFDYSLTQPPSINDIGICPKVKLLQSRALRELQNEIDKFALMESTPVEDFVWAGVQLLDVVIHLETLEIFSMLQGHWEMHHQAARRILNHIETCASMKHNQSESKTSAIEATLSSWPLGDARRRSLEFCITNFIWVDVLSISTFGIQSYSPCAFDYLGLLQSETIKPQHIMGCQGWIMTNIIKIARLEHWKATHHNQMHTPDINAELVLRGKQLEDELQDGIDKLERDKNRGDASIPDEDRRLISIVWAYGAQVLRQATISDIGPAQPDIDQTYVNACLKKLEDLPTRLIMRTTWPYTIAGCMSLSESQHVRFRWIFGKIMQEAQPPGISWKGLIIMEECWRLRQLEADRKVGWREAMESLGARVILT
ncbi:fungal-specific transcription factor domain-containing protein [Xylogone sp. PMI_703]|nr:fungal-specific transcription factor domain-containing protein [Xylogone sp. PMI_703]